VDWNQGGAVVLSGEGGPRARGWKEPEELRAAKASVEEEGEESAEGSSSGGV
jgi:hypothetical protein